MLYSENIKQDLRRWHGLASELLANIAVERNGAVLEGLKKSIDQCIEWMAIHADNTSEKCLVEALREHLETLAPDSQAKRVFSDHFSDFVESLWETRQGLHPSERDNALAFMAGALRDMDSAPKTYTQRRIYSALQALFDALPK